MKRSMVVLTAAVLFSVAAQAAVPSLVNFQARLADSNGNAVADGDYQVAFTIYAAATGGTALWTEAQTVAVAEGVFSAALGSVTALGLAFDAQYWLALDIEGDGEMTPRFKLASAPYALRAASAASADTADALGSVTETDVLANATALAGKADGAALNDGDDATTPVGWNDLANVPAGFADDVDDDTQLTGAQVRNYIETNPIDLAAGTLLGGTVLSLDGHAHSSLSGPGGSPAGALVVDGAGNVGIGTAAPAATLEVAGDIAASGAVESRSGALIGANGESLSLGVTDDVFSVTTGGAERLRVHSDGRVGIGTATPAAALEVAGDIAASGAVESRSGALIGANGESLSLGVTDDVFSVTTGGAERLRVHSNGNVGIGTASPATWAKLDVAGKVKTQNVRAQVSATNAVSTNSATWVDMPDMSLTITTGNSPVLMMFKAGDMQAHTATPNRSRFRMLVDGVEKTKCFQEFHNGGWELRDVALNWLETLSEGAHTIKVQWSVDWPTATACWFGATRSLIALEM